MLHLATQSPKKKVICVITAVLAPFLALGVALTVTRPAEALPLSSVKVRPIPAFARKYSMPCSACHDSWPRLSPFGQAFKDNGYQLMNGKDAPIYQNPSYWPISFRITPQWHVERTNRVAVDSTPGNPNPTEAGITTHGFDWSGLDILTEGTLAKNISFIVLPSADSTGAFHMEAVFVRFDNIATSSWLNVKVGKFELDNLQSEKRILTLSNEGGFYQNYHFQPLVSPGVSENYVFGLGDNQVGLEWMGHSKNDRTRISASLLTSNDGSPGLTSNNGGGVASGGPLTGKTYDGFFAASQAFQVGDLGLQRVGGFAYIGQAPTSCKFMSGGVCIDSTGSANKMYYRAGAIGMFFIKKFDVTAMYFRGWDNVLLASSDPTAHAPSWNGALVEPHYTVSPRLIFTGRYEAIRMSQQVFDSNPANLGNIDAGTIGFRYYPFISSRAGFAFHNEFSVVRQRGAAPVSGKDLTSGSVLLGLDFAF
jgi:hypothetical protein